jgi:F0F1-type ATP synthase membrane subunit b/b'
MEIFKWVEEIEKIYDDLIEKAKNESLEEIKKVQSSQAKVMEEMIFKNQESLNDALARVTKDVRGKTEEFDALLKDLCVKIEQYYIENKKELTDLLLEKLGFDF